MKWRWTTAVGACALVGLAAPAFADEASGVEAQLEALKRQVEAQRTQIERLEGTGMTQDEVALAVDQYMARSPAVAYLCAGEGGFGLGKKPYLKEGPNKLDIAFRNQVRYEAFLYSDDARANTTDTTKPHDRSGFEIERLYVGFDGTIFCEDITFKLELNFDSDSGGDVEKRYAYLDWKYAGEHHIRAGTDKIAFSMQENTSSGKLAFVDRPMATKAFEMGFDHGVSLWGYFCTSCCPKQFMYKLQATNGEGNSNDITSIFNVDAKNTHSDTLLFAGMFEWNITCDEWGWDEVDNRPCDKRCKLDLSLGVAAYFENDNDKTLKRPGGLVLKGTGALGVAGAGPLDRSGYEVWLRGQYNGWSFQTEYYKRHVEWTEGVTIPDQDDSGWYAQLHYRFAESNWGLGVRYGIVWADDGYYVAPLKDEFSEVAAVINYFFWDHNSKISADATFITGNSGVSSSSAGYMVSSSKGVVVEDGVMLRIQWQMNL